MHIKNKSIKLNSEQFLIKPILIFILSINIFLSPSCSNNSSEINDAKEPISDTIKPIQIDMLTNKPIAIPISDEFLQLAINLDSAGFHSDTVRLKKTYSYRTLDNPIIIKGYTFFQNSWNNSALEMYLNGSGKNIDTIDPYEYDIDYRSFEIAKSVFSYLFTQKISESNTGTKWFVDGTFEEWCFPDSNAAIIAAKDIAFGAGFVYFNVGAYVCYHHNYMYILTSRASAFMYALKPYFYKFVEENNMVMVSN